ncbi:MAG: ATPase [Candidatus Micrarchaeaceae archaeon]|jgi:V/A-type H+/Na+-transporting ATPase subunit K
MTVDMPAAIAALSAAAAIIGTGIGTAITQSAIGSAGMGLLAEKPEETGKVLLFLVLPETILIFGFVVAILILLGAGFV